MGKKNDDSAVAGLDVIPDTFRENPIGWENLKKMCLSDEDVSVDHLSDKRHFLEDDRGETPPTSLEE